MFTNCNRLLATGYWLLATDNCFLAIGMGLNYSALIHALLRHSTCAVLRDRRVPCQSALRSGWTPAEAASRKPGLRFLKEMHEGV
jgi:hypothetical protein